MHSGKSRVATKMESLSTVVVKCVNVQLMRAARNSILQCFTGRQMKTVVTSSSMMAMVSYDILPNQNIILLSNEMSPFT